MSVRLNVTLNVTGRPRTEFAPATVTRVLTR
jgi:hypothetical protein